MYNPSTGQDHEYIELHNISESALDLSDVRFTDGIDFDFPDGTTLASGAYLLVVRDLVAFENQYGAGLPVIGNARFSGCFRTWSRGELARGDQWRVTR